MEVYQNPIKLRLRNIIKIEPIANSLVFVLLIVILILRIVFMRMKVSNIFNLLYIL